MKFVIVFCSLVAAVIADSSTLLEPAYFPIEPLPVNTDPGLRVVNGQNAERNQLPYQVSLQRRILISFSHICGGSIVAPAWILTAAHCTQSAASTMRVLVGILLLNDQNIAGQQAIDVQRVINHPLYPGGSQVAPNDISLLQLSQSIVYTANNVRPIAIPRQGQVFNGNAVLSGWGLTRTGGSIPNHLQVANLPIVPAGECKRILDGHLGGSNRNPFSEELNVCSGIRNGGESACNGDSGGPLAQGNYVFGVVSWGLVPCGAANAPSVYNNVAAFSDWIVTQTNGAVRPE